MKLRKEWEVRYERTDPSGEITDWVLTAHGDTLEEAEANAQILETELFPNFASTFVRVSGPTAKNPEVS